MTEIDSPTSPFLLRRLAALTYDILLVLPLIMACVALVMGIRTLLGLGPADDGTVQLDANLVRLLALLTTMAFFCWFWLKNGQTLGMQAWRIKLVTMTGDCARPAPGPGAQPGRRPIGGLPRAGIPVVPGGSQWLLLARLPVGNQTAVAARQEQGESEEVARFRNRARLTSTQSPGPLAVLYSVCRPIVIHYAARQRTGNPT